MYRMLTHCRMNFVMLTQMMYCNETSLILSKDATADSYFSTWSLSQSVEEDLHALTRCFKVVMGPVAQRKRKINEKHEQERHFRR